VPPPETFVRCLRELLEASYDPSASKACAARLHTMDVRFRHYHHSSTQAEADELVEARSDPRARNFFGVRKVDNFAHHALALPQWQFAAFLRKKELEEGETVVATAGEGNQTTLGSVLSKCRGLPHAVDGLALSAAEQSVFGSPEAHAALLDWENEVGGENLAILTKAAIANLEAPGSCYAEWRIGLSGRSKSQWQTLATWFQTHSICSSHVRWVIAIPRGYTGLRKSGCVSSFGDLLRNLFEPLFEATVAPAEFPALARLMEQVVRFDSADEPLVRPSGAAAEGYPPPDQWTSEENPPYSYWIYSLYSNIEHLNALRRHKGLKPFGLSPGCDGGNVSHLATCFLLADSISEGCHLAQSPVLHYLYALARVGVTVPYSGRRDKSPHLLRLFRTGVRLALSTRGSVATHFTATPLLEELGSVASAWQLTASDLCELCLNSVVLSSFEPALKHHWVGEGVRSQKVEDHDVAKTHVPQARLQFRSGILEREMRTLHEHMDAT